MGRMANLTDRAPERTQRERNPVRAYLARLGGPASRRTQLMAIREMEMTEVFLRKASFASSMREPFRGPKEAD